MRSFINYISRNTISVIRNPLLLFTVSIMKISKFIKSDELYLRALYFFRMGRFLNLNNPTLFTEKLQWIKLHDRKDIYHTMVDKYDMKKYVTNKIGDKYIIPTLGVWDKFDDIDIDLLPNKFIIKCTHDQGSYYICTDKDNFDINSCKQKIEKGLNRNHFLLTREWPYKNLKRRILAEPLLQDTTSPYLTDYKFYCFNGIPKIFYIATNRGSKEGLSEDFFDIKGNHLEIKQKGHPNNEKKVELPKNLKKMIEYAKILSQETLHLRVDFYEVNNNLYVGELTFFDGGGMFIFEPRKYDEIIGSWLDLKI